MKLKINSIVYVDDDHWNNSKLWYQLQLMFDMKI